MLQKSDGDGDITIIYNQDDNVRHVRMNATHPTDLLPSPMGDAVGHWEGETLVIDTVGIKTNPFIAADMYGTPQSAAMHVIERYRLIDGALAWRSRVSSAVAERRSLTPMRLPRDYDLN
jgi:hypothetical protein